jgi:3-phenylpropionate/cinnamic acid dioxygenase small subunit
MTDVEASTTGTGRTRIRATDPVFLEILEFLTDEATLLDHDEHLQWLETLTDDINYRMPMRETRYRFDGKGFSDEGYYYDDDRLSLGLRARRNTEFQYAYDRDPAPRIRRLVTNLTVYEGDKPDEYRATSYILLLKNRFDNPTYDLLTAERDDVIRRTPDGLKLAVRDIYVDMQLLSTFTWVNVFL